MKDRKSKRVSNKINNFLEMPREISDDNPKITIIGFDEMLIENYKGILEYEEFYIKVKTVMGNININGFNLSLKQVTEDDISIKGAIESLDIDRISDDEE